MEEQSDKVIMQKVKFGDIDKLALLYERYKRPLFAYFVRNIEDKEQSEDLVQTVFYRILKYRKHYRGQGKFTTWMFSIAHNLIADWYKKKRSIPISIDILELKTKEKQADSSYLIEKNEQLQLIRLSLRKMSFEKREVLILSKYHELKYKEIADILGVKENLVKQRVFRAIDELKQIYLEMTN